jgi:hypothetical protein
MEKDAQTVLEEIAAKAALLPDHSADEIEGAAHHLEMLHYQNLIDFTKKNFIRLTKTDFLDELRRVLKFTPRELGVTATVAEDWTRGEAAAEENRILRLEFMFRRFKKLSGLRSNDPEAWDEINELYFDD